MMVLSLICRAEPAMPGGIDPLLLSSLPCFNLTIYIVKYHRELFAPFQFFPGGKTTVTCQCSGEKMMKFKQTA